MVAIINIFLSLFGLPWVHAALPHSPLHMKGTRNDTHSLWLCHWIVSALQCVIPRLNAFTYHCLSRIALGDITEVTVDGQVHPKMVNVRETRLSGLISHLLILFSIFMYPTPLKDIPMAVS